MIVVKLTTNKHTGKHYYKPVNKFSFGVLGELTVDGCHWFYPSEWQRIAARAAERGLKLTNRWYHIQRSREPGF